jgi:catechol 2,3-dioxygenase-like lactoylglutathione lyase family enzyme
MEMIGIDHLVLTVASIERTVAFYRDVLGLRAESFGPDPPRAPEGRSAASTSVIPTATWSR